MKAPYFWTAGLDPASREAAPFLRLLLTPVSVLYGWGVQQKLAHARPKRIAAPVICVGNLTAGGAGKTPVAQAVRERLSRHGLAAATLSRGYGGRLRGPLRVDPSLHTAADVGDEPLLLSQTGAAWIGRNRTEAAAAMQAAGVEAIVLDDGHQNPSLAKDLSLVVIDAAAPFGNGHLLPKGPLREPICSGLARADAVVLMGPGPVPGEVAASRRPVLRAAMKADSPVPDGPLVAFAGIARPQKFFDALAADGAELADCVPYPDHHPYSVAELGFLRRLAAERGARLITTAKDHVRLAPADRATILVREAHAIFDGPDALDAVLAPVLNRVRHDRT